jgi:hypothetical protein
MKTYYEDAGKGDHARKRDVSEETFRNNWDAIFGKKKNSGCSTESEKSSQEDVPVGE